MEDYDSWDFFDPEDGVTTTHTRTSNVRVEHDGAQGILQSFVTSYDSSQYCTSAVYRLILLSKSWGSPEQKAVDVWGSYCDHTAKHGTDVETMVDSFRLVEPY